MKDSSRVGCSIGVLLHGKKCTYHYGESARGTHRLPTNESLYEIGSMTKTFTGLLVAHAIGEGRIKLNDDIRKYLPGTFPHLQYPSGDPLKIGYLLAYTSQLPNSFVRAADETLTDTSFIRQLAALRPDTLKPFTYRYSNAGYQVLGRILEHIYGATYQQLLERYITKPLGMHATTITIDQQQRTDLLKGYDAAGLEAPSIYTSFPAAGSIKSTLSDMLKYLHYQLQEKEVAVKMTHRILYGNIDDGATCFQWATGKTWNWDYYFRADGGTPGFRTFYSFYPDYDLAIVLLSNQNNDTAGRKLYELSAAILKAVKSH
ncbi:serine hydrolase domain-containing protein [Paraflavitalea speifideaquila]|uniref:serine hydrolase domain-containing protein n=1 Tax=Paraflavitalea speifideaquila TaxID=3076558 RepID=UPI0028E61217|nr:serine hydrolase domain-containing protein [Paraflavitalea speifideiaquila]